MEYCMIRQLRAYEECRAFVGSFYGDPVFSDPMLSNEEQLRNNLLQAFERPESHCVLAVIQNDKMIGLFSFLVLTDERYLEMIVGLSRSEEAYRGILPYLEENYPSYDGDFVFNPNNFLLRNALENKNARFEPEQQKMLLCNPVPCTNTEGIELLSQTYMDQYCAMHNRDLYWTADKVAAATDKFRTLLAIEDGAIVGYLDVTHCFEENEPYDLLVREDHRRKGYGRKLFAKAIELNKPKGMMLLVDVDNTPAIRLYESLGFTKAENQNSLTAHWKIGSIQEG